ncbi:MAG: FAD-dependent oxidoreductase [Planctomycetota bacterium]
MTPRVLPPWQAGSRLAIVGSGISGLTAAHHLHHQHDLVLFEAAQRLGGHTHTIDVEWHGRRHAVDTGFIVFNRQTYPHFSALLDDLGVTTRPTTMSFSVRCDRTGLEYNGTNWNGIFAQRRNLLRPRFLRMLRDIARFHRISLAELPALPTDLSLGAFLDRREFGRELVQHYVVPMGAAIWSARPERILDFPAATFLRFLANHGMLSIDERPTWRTVAGGSQTYVERMVAPFAHKIRRNAPVAEIRRDHDGVWVRTAGSAPERFDGAIIATHSDQALRVLADPSAAERAVLAAIPYQANDAVLHRDASVLPRARRAWAAWNYVVPRHERTRVAVTYEMNILQGLDAGIPLCVTLNQDDRIDPDKVFARIPYHHPVFDAAGIAAQARWHELAGHRRTWFCGAYWRYGFHEDGVVSGLRVVEDLRARRQAGISLAEVS